MLSYQLKKSAYFYYIVFVKGNKKISYEDAQKKLNRNIALAIKVHIEDNRYVYLYGNLHIYTKGNVITKIRNYKGVLCDWFYKDHKRFDQLNKELGIKDVQKSKWNEVGDLSYIEEYAKGFKQAAN
jgi:hypothetical protein